CGGACGAGGRRRAAGETPRRRALCAGGHSRGVGFSDGGAAGAGALPGPAARRYPLLSARLERFPTRATREPNEPWISGSHWLRLPPQGSARELTLSFILRVVQQEPAPLRIDNLPIPGRP